MSRLRAAFWKEPVTTASPTLSQFTASASLRCEPAGSYVLVHRVAPSSPAYFLIHITVPAPTSE